MMCYEKQRKHEKDSLLVSRFSSYFVYFLMLFTVYVVVPVGLFNSIFKCFDPLFSFVLQKSVSGNLPHGKIYFKF